MAHSILGVQTNNSSSGNANNMNTNTNTNSNSNSNSNNANNKMAQIPVILQRNTSQPIDITASTNNGAFHKPSAPTVAQQLAFNKMEKKKTNRSRYDKNMTFSAPVDDPVMDEDFDFEKNLALFDKQAIWDKIDANQKPDLVYYIAIAIISKKKPNSHSYKCYFILNFRSDKLVTLTKK